MLATIGVLSVLFGMSIFMMALFRYFFPSVESLIPDEFKKILKVRIGVYVFLAGIILLRFF